MHKHRKKSALREVILGGQDGLVNVLGLSLGLFAAHAGSKIILVAGLAAGLAESISMGAVAYTSSLADRDFYLKSKEVELQEIETMPDLEKEEIRNIYQKKGFTGDILDQIVESVCSNRELMLNTMMQDELMLQPIDTHGLIFSSFIVGLSALIGSLIPLTPFLFLSVGISMLVAVIISALVLFCVGAYKAKTLVGVWWKAGIQMLLIGMISAFAGFLIGLVLKVD